MEINYLKEENNLLRDIIDQAATSIADVIQVYLQPSEYHNKERKLFVIIIEILRVIFGSRCNIKYLIDIGKDVLLVSKDFMRSILIDQQGGLYIRDDIECT